MQYKIQPSSLRPGTLLNIPPSKSYFQRFVALAAFYPHACTIRQIGKSDDDQVAYTILQQLNRSVRLKASLDRLDIDPLTQPIQADADFHFEHAGLSARMFIPILACLPGRHRFTGSKQLSQRPMQGLLPLQTTWSCTIDEWNGFLPFTLQGPAQIRDIHIDGQLSSQFLTGFLFATALFAKHKTSIRVSHLQSRPYIDISLHVLQMFGFHVEHSNYDHFILHPVSIAERSPVSVSTPSDWSAAAIWVIYALLKQVPIRLQHMALDDFQADRSVLNILKSMITVQREGSHLVIQPKGRTSFDADIQSCPDLGPILAVLAMFTEGTSKIKGIHRLIHKESDRKTNTEHLLKAFGISFRIQDDCWLIQGNPQATLHMPLLEGYQDHRMVMASIIAIAAGNQNGLVTDVDAINKSYPDFMQHFSETGGLYTTE